MLSLTLFTLILAMVSFLAFVYLIEPGPGGRVQYLTTKAALLAHKYDLVDHLDPAQTRQLYLSTCTRQCHGKDVIELTPRTALEWEQIVTRMGKQEKASIGRTEAKTIIEYLQRNHLSNVPTILPEATMRFLKKRLWRLDFGESDLYFDIIYLPRGYRHLMPYLAFKSKPVDSDEALFIVYVNTHTGILPPWDLAKYTAIRIDGGEEAKAANWQVLYEDGQLHHRQGVLTFPDIDQGAGARAGSLEMLIRPPAMRERIFHWRLPIPDAGLRSTKTKQGGDKQ
ncbi:MAG: hypothetical protein QGG19_14575 [Alphaproteobacteria bacterium]|jgi:hypothetical protein|nr:hypothetical protein [Rhodospirillaceae bacterium]MDP6022505.1 hypothetical protein [Alphaproteobacteria bacterium]MDP6255510.1 hypothetical protein [Alphaproteobacteria bacterium]MDP7056537.1 hypothetical protein [Alphaproteobacteria bacterium]MDP7229502.1 hypothetical protein [Alphaproteobacteria bacterium]|tara:strand:- start:17820 stop:18665 length:846 start_codon:yes stop_codon:yes gene_type:complete